MVSDDSTRFIDEAQSAAEDVILGELCRRRRGTFIVLRIKRSGFRIYRGCTLIRARISLSDKAYERGSWLIAERTRDGEWVVRESNLTWFSPTAIAQLAQHVGERWYRCYTHHPSMGELPLAS